jgi:DNA-binding FadR family transcriptional regulator
VTETSETGQARDDQLPREQRLRDRLAVKLAREIVSGRLQHDAAFPSADDIVRQYGVSRTVAREALQTLSMVGLVHAQQGKRTEILDPSGWNVLSSVVQEALLLEGKIGPLLRDLYDFRLLIEPAAAGWMASRGSDEELAALRALSDQMQAMARSGETLARFLAADRDFHTSVASAAGNRILAGVRRDIGHALASLDALCRLTESDFASVAKQHARIASAVEMRDAEAAERAMRRHVEWARDADLDDRRQATFRKRQTV